MIDTVDLPADAPEVVPLTTRIPNPAPPRVIAIALLSLAIWLGVISCGRLIAYL